MPVRRVILDWELSCDFGWGLLGYNIFCQWANDASIKPVSGRLITEERLGLTDPLRMSMLAPEIEDSNDYLRAVASIVPKPVKVAADVIVPVSHGLGPSIFRG